MKVGLEQKQVQIISGQVIQQMEILRMSSQELLEHVERTALENPVLEFSSEYAKQAEFDRIAERLNWLDRTSVHRSGQEQPAQEYGDDPLYTIPADEESETLYQHLSSQLDELTLPSVIRRGADYLAQSLNRNGWLDEDLSLLAEECDISLRDMNKALQVIQGLDPAGVGGRSLSECLSLQLAREYPNERLALLIAEKRLTAMAKGQYNRLSQEFSATEAEVLDACALIRSLNPRPGSAYAYDHRPIYTIPDIIITVDENQCVIHSNDFFSLGISNYYSRIIRDCDDSETKQYLADKMRQAKFIIHAVEQRKSTVTKCVQHILNTQSEFFTSTSNRIMPLTLSDIAHAIGVRESTVSRAIRHKALQCSKGIFPLSFFFSRAVGENHVFSSKDAKALLKRLISNESSFKPLSDQKLCEAMAAEGCLISRRTIAKYRDELGIPNTSVRKQR